MPLVNSHNQAISPNHIVVHDQFVLDGEVCRSDSWLDIPLAATDAGRAYIESRTDFPDEPTFLDGLRSYCVEEHNQIMGLPNNVEGLDIDRVRRFMRDLGAPMRDFRVLDTDHYGAAYELNLVSGRHGVDDGDTAGAYKVESGVAIIRRDSAYEERFGTAYRELVESHIVHEAAGHGWVRPIYDGYKPSGGWFIGGFKPEGVNNAFEEGFAILLQLIYLKQCCKTGQERAIMDLGTPALYAASIFSRIAEHDTDFLTLLTQARTSSDALEQVQERLNRVRHNLYEDLVSARPYEVSNQRDLKALDAEVAMHFAKHRDQFGRTFGRLVLRGSRAFERIVRAGRDWSGGN